MTSDVVRYRGRPIYFLLLLAGIWSVPRLAYLTLSAQPAPPHVPQVSDRPIAASLLPLLQPSEYPEEATVAVDIGPPVPYAATLPPSRHGLRERHGTAIQGQAVEALPAGVAGEVPTMATVIPQPLASPADGAPVAPLSPETPARRTSRWSGYAWMFVRGEGPAGLATGAQYGGSQGGVIVRRALDPDGKASAYVRLSRALSGRDAEGAIGLRLQPVSHVPVALHLEQRQALDSGPRRGTAIFLAGGVDAMPLAKELTVSAFWQGGHVGGANPSAFLETQAYITRPVFDSMRAGLGVWTGAQKGAARVDVGPRLEWRQGNALLAVDWRVRVAGNAKPQTGPALTLATEF